MSEESTTRNLEQELLVGKSKTLEGHTNWINSLFVKDNLIISGSRDNTILITPITLFPGELEVFQSVIDEYWLAMNLEQELLGYVIPTK